MGRCGQNEEVKGWGRWIRSWKRVGLKTAVASEFNPLPGPDPVACVHTSDFAGTVQVDQSIPQMLTQRRPPELPPARCSVSHFVTAAWVGGRTHRTGLYEYSCSASRNYSFNVNVSAKVCPVKH